MKIFLPSMPSLYVTSFLFCACEEVHRVGGHVLDKQVLQNFASRLLDKVCSFPFIVSYFTSYDGGFKLAYDFIIDVFIFGKKSDELCWRFSAYCADLG